MWLDRAFYRTGWDAGYSYMAHSAIPGMRLTWYLVVYRDGMRSSPGEQVKDLGSYLGVYIIC